MSVAAPSLAADTKDTDTGSAKDDGDHWYNGWFGAKAKDKDKEAIKPAKPRGKEDLAKEDAQAKRKPETDSAAAERAREVARYLRRLAACDQLRLMAVQTKDDALLQQAEQLEQRAEQIYTQRIAHLPASRANAAGDATGSPADSGAALYTVRGKDSVGHPVSGEEKP
jgi:hypothetical protein